MVHLVPICTNDTAADLAAIYLREAVRLHGLPQSIVSDRDPKFTSKFWRELHCLLGAELLMSTTFHPQTDGISKRTICLVNQILRSMVKPDQLDWLDKILLTEFAINSSVSASTGFAPFKLNYRYLPQTMAGISTDSAFTGVCKFAQRAHANLEMAHDALIGSCVNQTHYVNQSPKGRARKLVPKYIGPYKIVGANVETSSYTLELPPNLVE